MYNRDIIIGSTSGKGDKTLIKLGEYNKLIVKRETNFGYFVGEEGSNSNDDVLLHNRLLNKQKVEVGDEIEVFIYRDSEGRLSATLEYPKAKLGGSIY